jgi:hypothetical protein
MFALRYRLIGPLWLITAVLWPMAVLACNVPVFRYALERWEPDPYVFVVFHSQPLTEEQQALVKALEDTSQEGLANLAVVKVNVSDKMSEPMQALWKSQGSPALPWMVVRYPPQLRIEQSVWAGPLKAEDLRLLLDSPARREIVRHLMKAETSVWLLLECGDKKQDDAAAQILETESKRLEKELVLPEQSPMDPEINPNLPLKIAFSILRVARSDPAERMLVNMLLNCDTNLSAATGAMLFPIFGRGRVVPPATGEEIQPEAIREMAEFLTGPCSCEVKEMNPGYDLLLSANWKSLGDYQSELMTESPPLTGLSQFAAGATNDPKARSGQPSASLASAGTEPVARGHLVRNLAVVLGIGIVFLAAATLVLKTRAGRRA